MPLPPVNHHGQNPQSSFPGLQWIAQMMQNLQLSTTLSIHHLQETIPRLLLDFLSLQNLRHLRQFLPFHLRYPLPRLLRQLPPEHLLLLRLSLRQAKLTPLTFILPIILIFLSLRINLFIVNTLLMLINLYMATSLLVQITLLKKTRFHRTIGLLRKTKLLRNFKLFQRIQPM